MLNRFLNDNFSTDHPPLHKVIATMWFRFPPPFELYERRFEQGLERAMNEHLNNTEQISPPRNHAWISSTPNYCQRWPISEPRHPRQSRLRLLVDGLLRLWFLESPPASGDISPPCSGAASFLARVSCTYILAIIRPNTRNPSCCISASAGLGSLGLAWFRFRPFTGDLLVKFI